MVVDQIVIIIQEECLYEKKLIDTRIVLRTVCIKVSKYINNKIQR